jgi:peptidoglycan hydrolase CwlO-like protein
MLDKARHDLEGLTKEIEDHKWNMNRIQTEQNRFQVDVNKRMGFYDQECTKLDDAITAKQWYVYYYYTKDLISMIYLFKCRQMENLDFKINEMYSKLDEIDGEINKTSTSIQNGLMNIDKISKNLDQCCSRYEEMIVSLYSYRIDNITMLKM